MVEMKMESRFHPCTDTARGRGTANRSSRPGSTDSSSGTSLAPCSRQERQEWQEGEVGGWGRASLDVHVL